MSAGAAVTMVVAPMTAGASPRPAAQATESLTVVSSDPSGYPDVRVVVASPPQLSNETLDASAFKVIEGGKERKLTAEALPVEQLEVALVVDTSYSMNGAPLAAAKMAAKSFLDQLPASVPVAVVGFGAQPSVVSPRSTDRAAQQAAVSRLSASGETALYDALTTAIDQFPAVDGHRRIIVVLSDGGDTSSTIGLNDVSAAVAQSRASVFAVELRTADSNPDALAQITTAAGGKVIPATDPGALAGAFDSVAKQLVRQYALTYRSEARGATELKIQLAAGTVEGSVRHLMTLPETSDSPAAADPAIAAEETAPASGDSAWKLYAGVAMVFGALVVVLVRLLAFRTPRARGFTTRRGLGLAGAAARAQEFTETALRPSAQSALTAALEAAGLDIRPGEFVVTVTAGALAGVAIGWMLASPVMGLVLAAIAVLVAKAVLSFLAGRRRKQFGEQLGETLQMLSGSLRAGHGFAQAVDTVAREAESPTSDEFRRLTIETRLGRDLTESMADIAQRMGSTDFDWVVQAVDIHREIGGDLAEIFDSLSDTIRARTRIRRQVAALSAEGKMSAWVLMLLPFGLGSVMLVTNPEYIKPLYSTAGGWLLMAIGAVLLTVGGLWLRRIVKPIF